VCSCCIEASANRYLPSASVLKYKKGSELCMWRHACCLTSACRQQPCPAARQSAAEPTPKAWQVAAVPLFRAGHLAGCSAGLHAHQCRVGDGGACAWAGGQARRQHHDPWSHRCGSRPMVVSRCSSSMLVVTLQCYAHIGVHKQNGGIVVSLMWTSCELSRPEGVALQQLARLLHIRVTCALQVTVVACTVRRPRLIPSNYCCSA
jgi:hypothetical protein